MTDRTNQTTLTPIEWEAIAVLRAATGVGLKHGVLALPGRMQEAIDVARGLLDRTREEVNNAKY